jgi:hypothetical protein
LPVPPLSVIDLGRRAGYFHESFLDPDVDHKTAAGDALAIAAVAGMND